MNTKKTNAMRLLENAQIEYRMFEYSVDDGLIDAVSIARKIGENVEQVFKTLVTQRSPRPVNILYLLCLPMRNWI